MTESSDDVKMFENLLRAMGVDNFDPLVPVALNDYARRFASELLCDAKDYSVHRQASEIGIEDIQLAVKLGDVRVTGVDPRDSIVNVLKNKINRKELFAPVDKDAVLIRYPESFPQRNHTFVPGYDAYPEPSSEKMEVISAEVTDLNSDASAPPLNTKTSEMPHSILKFSTATSTAKNAKKLSPTKGFENDDAGEEN